MAERGPSISESNRAFFERQREKLLTEISKKKEEIKSNNQLKLGNERFVAQNDYVENELKRQTVGLVHLEDFQRIKESLKKQDDVKEEQVLKKRKKKIVKSTLSFADDNEDLDAMDEQEEISIIKKTKKNPAVDTSFLPDKDREEAEHRERDRLKKVWLEEQDRIKNEKVLITYSYWDGYGHRSQVECNKGDSISQFIDKAKKQWTELRGVHTDNLLFVKEDLIIPHHYTFYDFIVSKARGKSGPLFNFDVKDDIRLQNDASIEVEDTHAGKLMEKAWYEKNKHIFPASRWEVFDPKKDYGRYTIKDKALADL